MDETWITLVQIARDCGDISSLFPPGIERLTDLPFTIAAAVTNALVFLSWRELERDEQPPKSIWLDSGKLKGWWKQVEYNRGLKREGREPETMDTNALAAHFFPDG